ncbi:ABC transporter substrate-binding protein [Rhodopila sp.]|uniref:ABC transporter substrate-binding protein n=1 Tax=Rhodopila sp. TaxID=2480087 RepID=UPI003D0EE065
MAAFALSKPGTKQLAPAMHGDDWAHGYRDGAADYVESHGGKIVAATTLEHGATDAIAQALQIKASGAKAVMGWRDYTPAVILISGHIAGLLCNPCTDVCRNILPAPEPLAAAHRIGIAELTPILDLLKTYRHTCRPVRWDNGVLTAGTAHSNDRHCSAAARWPCATLRRRPHREQHAQFIFRVPKK